MVACLVTGSLQVKRAIEESIEITKKKVDNLPIAKKTHRSVA